MEYFKEVKGVFIPCEEHELSNGDKYRCIQESGVVVTSYYYKEEPIKLIPINIISVEGALMYNSTLTDITCYELTDVVVSGELSCPDQIFRMPIKRNDGKETIFIVNLVDGKFNAVLNFPTSGEYTYTNEQANSKFPYPIFDVAPISITVARKTGA